MNNRMSTMKVYYKTYDYKCPKCGHKRYLLSKQDTTSQWLICDCKTKMEAIIEPATS